MVVAIRPIASLNKPTKTVGKEQMYTIYQAGMNSLRVHRELMGRLIVIDR